MTELDRLCRVAQETAAAQQTPDLRGILLAVLAEMCKPSDAVVCNIVGNWEKHGDGTPIDAATKKRMLVGYLGGVATFREDLGDSDE